MVCDPTGQGSDGKVNSRAGEQGKEKAGEGRAEEKDCCSTGCTCALKSDSCQRIFQSKDKVPPLKMTGKEAVNSILSYPTSFVHFLNPQSSILVSRH